MNAQVGPTEQSGLNDSDTEIMPAAAAAVDGGNARLARASQGGEACRGCAGQVPAFGFSLMNHFHRYASVLRRQRTNLRNAITLGLDGLVCSALISSCELRVSICEPSALAAGVPPLRVPVSPFGSLPEFSPEPTPVSARVPLVAARLAVAVAGSNSTPSSLHNLAS